MPEKQMVDLETFVEKMNKKGEKRNGIRIRFFFRKRKRLAQHSKSHH